MRRCASWSLACLMLVAIAGGCTDGRGAGRPEPAASSSQPGPTSAEPAPEPKPEPASSEPVAKPKPAPEPSAEPPPAPPAGAAPRDPWEVRVEGVEVEVRELVSPDRSYEADGKTYFWFVEGLVADDATLWLAEQAAVRGHSGRELAEPGARITRWSPSGGSPEVLNPAPMREITLFAAFGDDILVADYDIFTEVTKLLRLPRAGGPLEQVTSFDGNERMLVSADGKRIELHGLGKALDPRTGKLRELGEPDEPDEPDLSGCKGLEDDQKRVAVELFDGHAVWVAIDEVKTDLFRISRGADGRLRHCRLADGSVHTLAKLRARWLNLEYAWTGTKLVFALDGGVYALELPGGA